MLFIDLGFFYESMTSWRLVRRYLGRNVISASLLLNQTKKIKKAQSGFKTTLVFVDQIRDPKNMYAKKTLVPNIIIVLFIKYLCDSTTSVFS